MGVAKAQGQDVQVTSREPSDTVRSRLAEPRGRPGKKRYCTAQYPRSSCSDFYFGTKSCAQASYSAIVGFLGLHKSGTRSCPIGAIPKGYKNFLFNSRRETGQTRRSSVGRNPTGKIPTAIETRHWHTAMNQEPRIGSLAHATRRVHR